MYADPSEKTRPLSVRLSEKVIAKLEAGLTGMKKSVSDAIRQRVERDILQNPLQERRDHEAETLTAIRRQCEQGGVLDFVDLVFLAERAHASYGMSAGQGWYETALIRDNLAAFETALAYMDPAHRADLHDNYYLDNFGGDGGNTITKRLQAARQSLQGEFVTINPERWSRNLKMVLQQIYERGQTPEQIRVATALAPYTTSLLVLAARAWWTRNQTSYEAISPHSEDFYGTEDKVAFPQPMTKFWTHGCFRLNGFSSPDRRTTGFTVMLDVPVNAILLSLPYLDFENLIICLLNYNPQAFPGDSGYRQAVVGNCQLLPAASFRSNDNQTLLCLPGIRVYLTHEQIDDLKNVVGQYRADPEIKALRTMWRMTYGAW